MKSEFEKEYEKARKKLQQLENISGILKLALKANNLDDIEDSAMAFSMEADNLMQSARRLPQYTGSTASKAKMEKQIIDVMNIHVGFTEDGWFAVRLPELLPKNKMMGRRSDYIVESLRITLADYFRRNDLIKLNQCVIVTCNVYDESRSQIAWRDYDNIDHKRAIDVLASFILIDDSPIFCDRLFCSFFGETDSTMIYLVPNIEMEKWLNYVRWNELPDFA